MTAPGREAIDAPARPAWPRVSFLDVILAAAVAAAIILVVLLGTMVWQSVHAPEPDRAGRAVLGLLLLEPAAIFAGLYFVIIWRRRATWRELGLRAIAPRRVLAAAGAAVLSLMASGIITQFTDRFYETSMIEDYARVLAPEGAGLGRALALFAMIGILVPAAEELLFRGLLYGWLRGRWGVAVSSVVSAGLFALAHANLRMGLQIFVIGIVLAVLYERSRTVLAPIVAHATINTLSILAIVAYANAQ
jgi:membrane protease YdiL (CAAX protease family)